MSTKRQQKKKDYKYCLECGRKFNEEQGRRLHIIDRYEPRDCIYGVYDKWR